MDGMMQAGLEPMTPDETAHGEKVARHLRALIAEGGGWMTFSRFMYAALYSPGLGYYMTNRDRFGWAGDFTTSPELSPLFARCLAVQIAEIFERTGGGDLIEHGAGSGRLAFDLLEALERLRALPHRYRIVDVSPALCADQRQLLAAAPVPVEWIDAPPAESWRGVVVANEVADALPVERFRITREGCEAIGVVQSGEGFAWSARPADPQLSAVVAALNAALPQPMAEGFVSEWCPGLPAWTAGIGATLEQGALLIADYGLPRTHYYHPSRPNGTLCGIHRHHDVPDPLSRTGIQDLSAWVDFSAIADAGRANGFAIAGFATQAHAMASLGVDRELAAMQEGVNESRRLRLAQAAQTLMMPGEMGEHFKLLALTRGIDAPLAAFGFRDLSASL
jgi:SAM-dependent MidA family methyltransferase